MRVDLLIVNARVATGDPRRPWADAVAVAGDVVVRIGSSAELRKLGPEIRVVDARGASVTIEGGKVVFEGTDTR
jgi:predicted amidohydrolase YtcJ